VFKAIGICFANFGAVDKSNLVPIVTIPEKVVFDAIAV
jgi:hypothetical protein